MLLVPAVKRSLLHWNSIHIAQRTCAAQCYIHRPSIELGCQQYMDVHEQQSSWVTSSKCPSHLRILHEYPSRNVLPLDIQADTENGCIASDRTPHLQQKSSFSDSQLPQSIAESDRDTHTNHLQDLKKACIHQSCAGSEGNLQQNMTEGNH